MATKSAYMNGNGSFLYTSAWTSVTYKASVAGQIVRGASGANNLYDTSGGDTLIGGSGDNTYYVNSSSTVVQQVLNGTTDTVETGLNYYLIPANIEDLTATANNQDIFGNSADDLITISGGGDQVNVGDGNDAIVEESWSSGSNIFDFSVGSGKDAIYGFNLGAMTHDFIELAGYGLTSYAQIAAHMSQEGSDVVIQLSPTNSVTIRNVQLSSLSSADFLLPVNTSTMNATFTDNFNNFTIWNPSVGGDIGWKTNFFFADQSESGSEAYTSRYLGNGGYPDLSLYTDPYFEGASTSTLGLDPFSVQNGVLTITATKVSAATAALMSGHTWSAGMISTQESFSQTYGYFEIRAKLPSGAGMDSAFWLWSDENDSEIDVFEQPNGSSEILQTVHGTNGATSYQTTLPADTSQFNTYGVLWTATTITFYVNGIATGSVATPSNMHDPMYMIANLGVGSGGWEGTPTANETSGQMQIDYIEAFNLADSAAAISAAAATITLTAAQTLAYEAGQTSLDPSGAAVAVADIAANIAENFDALNMDAAVASITLTDSGVPTLNLTVAQAVHDTSAIAEITNSSYQMDISDTSANLHALTAAQIQPIASEGVTKIVATNAGASYILSSSNGLQLGDAATIQSFTQSLGSSQFSESTTSVLTLSSAETLTIDGAASFAGTLTGAGALALTGGTTTVGTGASINYATLSETGSTTVLSLTETLSYAGAFAEAAGSTLKIGSGDTLNLTGSVSIGGMVSGAGSFAIAGGSATFGGGSARFAVSNWSISGAGTVVTFNQQVTYAGAFTEGAGATIVTNNGFVLTGQTILRGTVAGAQVFFTEGATTVGGLIVGGAVQWYNTGTTIENGGNVTLGDSSNVALSVYNSATYDITDNSGFMHGASAASSFNNHGLLEKTGGSGKSTVSVAVGNAATIAVTNGTLDLQGSVTGTGSIEVGGGATLEADATIASGQTLTYLPTHGEIALDDLYVSGSQLFHGSISGFGAGDSIDAGGFGAGTSVSYSELAGGHSGALTLTEGTMHASINLLGSFTTANFAAQNDGHGGTLIVYHS